MRQDLIFNNYSELEATVSLKELLKQFPEGFNTIVVQEAPRIPYTDGSYITRSTKCFPYQFNHLAFYNPQHIDRFKKMFNKALENPVSKEQINIILGEDINSFDDLANFCSNYILTEGSECVSLDALNELKEIDKDVCDSIEVKVNLLVLDILKTVYYILSEHTSLTDLSRDYPLDTNLRPSPQDPTPVPFKKVVEDFNKCINVIPVFGFKVKNHDFEFWSDAHLADFLNPYKENPLMRVQSQIYQEITGNDIIASLYVAVDDIQGKHGEVDRCYVIPVTSFILLLNKENIPFEDVEVYINPNTYDELKRLYDSIIPDEVNNRYQPRIQEYIKHKQDKKIAPHVEWILSSDEWPEELENEYEEDYVYLEDEDVYFKNEDEDYEDGNEEEEGDDNEVKSNNKE